MQKYAVLMAGGSGTRLWPLSKEASPKQFIPVGDGSSMLVRTIKRLCAVVKPEHCFIVTNKSLFDMTKETSGGLVPEANILLEPDRKNTAACIAYATLLLKKKLGEGVLCFVPADGYVRDTEGYAEALRSAFDAAEKVGALVIIGVRPTYPSTGYGYIHVEPAPAESSEVETDPATGKVDVPGEVAITGENTVPEGRPIPGEIPAAEEVPVTGAVPVSEAVPSPGVVSVSEYNPAANRESRISRVLDFIEKPDLEVAKELAASNDYLWNCGIVAGTMDSIIQRIKENIPEHYHKLSEALESNSDEAADLVGKAYNELHSISFDNGVLEKCVSSLYAVKAEFDWDDIGSIDALAKTLTPDSDGNLVKGRYIGINTTNSVIYGTDAAICTIDIDNMIVVGTKDEVLVCPRDRSQKVRMLVEKLKEQGHDDLL